MKTYRAEIRILREERDDENLRERDLVRNIISIWKEIRNLRTSQKHSNTSHKIIIHKEEEEEKHLPISSVSMRKYRGLVEIEPRRRKVSRMIGNMV